MNQRIIVKDSMIYGVIAIISVMLSTVIAPTVFISIAIMVLNMFAYRHGVKAFAVNGLIMCLSGMIVTLALSKTNDWSTVIEMVYFGIVSGIPGLFAKNVHRTLNNRKFNSVWLNVVVTQFLVGSLVFGEQLTGHKTMSLLDSVLLTILSIALIMVTAYSNPKMILTTRSAFLTRKERSKLLND